MAIRWSDNEVQTALSWEKIKLWGEPRHEPDQDVSDGPTQEPADINLAYLCRCTYVCSAVLRGAVLAVESSVETWHWSAPPLSLLQVACPDRNISVVCFQRYRPLLRARTPRSLWTVWQTLRRGERSSLGGRPTGKWRRDTPEFSNNHLCTQGLFLTLACGPLQEDPQRFIVRRSRGASNRRREVRGRLCPRHHYGYHAHSHLSDQQRPVQ